MAIRTALLSVSDKTGIVEFAMILHQLGIKLLSTGGTAELLLAQGLPVTEVADYTGFPEMMAGRLKTLHPKIHGGLLGRRGIDDAVMQTHGIDAIDLVVVNLYPFQATIARADCDLPMAIEKIDIGGPAMLRSAAKNYADVIVIVDPQDYAEIAQELKGKKVITLETRFRLAQKVFAHTAAYDSAIAHYLNQQMHHEIPVSDIFPHILNIALHKKEILRYGENPHQEAAFYVESMPPVGTISKATQLQGKALSFNNIADADAALTCVQSFEETACVIVKHANPCGIAMGPDTLSAYEKAFIADPQAAFGGIIAFNRTLDALTLQKILDNQFVEVIIAPDVAEDVLVIAKTKANLRLLITGTRAPSAALSLDYKRVQGGLLVQTPDEVPMRREACQCVTTRTPTHSEWEDLLFSWKAVQHVKSNAVVFAKEGVTLAIGAGQMSRVFSVEIACLKAKQMNFSLQSSVLASDAFFPFRDGIDMAAAAGVSAIIQPGGSVRDEEVIQAANEAGIAMVFTNIRHFKH